VGRPLKFCHLSTFYPPYSFGGDAVFLHRLANTLAQHGHEVDVIHCADSYHVLHPGPPPNPISNHPAVTVHTLKSPWGFLSPLAAQQTGRTWPKTARIRELLMSKKFDVIHYHNISLLGPEVLRLAPDYSDFVKAYTAHEHWLICPMHVLWKNNQRLCEKPECLRCTLKFRRPPQWWRYTRLLDSCAASVDTFFSPSRFTQEIHQQRGFLRNMEHLPHYVPRDETKAPQSETRPHSRPYFLFVGRLEKIKGLQNLIPVFRDYPHADLLVAGTGEYEAEVRHEAAGLQNIVFLGPLQQPQLQRLYRHAVAVIVPSICYEVFGIIILEAYRERTPVIVHRLGALQEVVEESDGGFSYQSPEELLAAMERLRTDEELRRTLGEQGFKKYLQHWSEEAHLKAYFQLLEGAAQQKFGYVPWKGQQRTTLEFTTSHRGDCK